MIKGVLFDWGGVLIENPADPVRGYCANALGVSVDQLVSTPVWEQHILLFQAGKIDEDALWHRITTELNAPPVTPGRSIWTEAFYAVYKEQTATLALTHRLQAQGHKVGFLSNTEHPTVAFLKKEHWPQYDHFDIMMFSCQEGLIKPDRTLYDRAVTKLGLSPSEIVFFDDRPDFIDGALQAGLHGRVFTHPDQAAQDLIALGVTL